MKHQTSCFTITWVDLILSICTFLKHHCSINTSYGKKKKKSNRSISSGSMIKDQLLAAEYCENITTGYKSTSISKCLLVYCFGSLMAFIVKTIQNAWGGRIYIIYMNTYIIYICNHHDMSQRGREKRNSYCRIVLSFRNEMSMMSYWIGYRVGVVRELF